MKQHRTETHTFLLPTALWLFFLLLGFMSIVFAEKEIKSSITAAAIGAIFIGRSISLADVFAQYYFPIFECLTRAIFINICYPLAFEISLYYFIIFLKILLILFSS